MFKSASVWLSLALCLLFAYSDTRAGETSYSAVNYVAAGVLMIDVGASVANGIGLAADRPDRLNGYVGVAAGAISLVFVAADLALTDDEDLRNEFALVFGTAGVASLVTGALVIRRASAPGERSSGTSGVRFLPYVGGGGNRAREMGVSARIAF